MLAPVNLHPRVTTIAPVTRQPRVVTLVLQVLPVHVAAVVLVIPRALGIPRVPMVATATPGIPRRTLLLLGMVLKPRVVVTPAPEIPTHVVTLVPGALLLLLLLLLLLWHRDRNLVLRPTQEQTQGQTRANPTGNRAAAAPLTLLPLTSMLRILPPKGSRIHSRRILR